MQKILYKIAGDLLLKLPIKNHLTKSAERGIIENSPRGGHWRVGRGATKKIGRSPALLLLKIYFFFLKFIPINIISEKIIFT
jgi:hypothetical protein